MQESFLKREAPNARKFHSNDTSGYHTVKRQWLVRTIQRYTETATRVRSCLAIRGRPLSVDISNSVFMYGCVYIYIHTYIHMYFYLIRFIHTSTYMTSHSTILRCCSARICCFYITRSTEAPGSQSASLMEHGFCPSHLAWTSPHRRVCSDKAEHGFRA